jgi:hypothetical protein
MSTHRPTLEDCFNQFVDRDYRACAVSATMLGQSDGWSVHLLYFLLISLIRSGDMDIAGEVGNQFSVSIIPMPRASG